MNKRISHSLEETGAIAKEWLNHTQGRPRGNHATVVGLSGDLGAGKTAFVKCVAKELSITEDVTSPTFVIMKIYEVGPLEVEPLWKHLVHIDAYRLDSGRELDAIDFQKYAADPDNLILIEWPENVKEAVEGLEGYSRINFSVGEGEMERVIEI